MLRNTDKPEEETIGQKPHNSYASSYDAIILSDGLNNIRRPKITTAECSNTLTFFHNILRFHVKYVGKNFAV